MTAPEGFKPLWEQSKQLSPEELGAKKIEAMQAAVARYGTGVALEEGYEVLVDDTGEVFVSDGPVFVPKEAEPEQRAISENYWQTRDRRNLCDQEYIGPRDIM
jgi:hypothetical protein